MSISIEVDEESNARDVYEYKACFDNLCEFLLRDLPQTEFIHLKIIANREELVARVVRNAHSLRVHARYELKQIHARTVTARFEVVLAHCLFDYLL